MAMSVMDSVPQVLMSVKAVIELISRFKGSQGKDDELGEILEKLSAITIENENKDKLLQQLQEDVLSLKTKLLDVKKCEGENNDDALKHICARMDAMLNKNAAVPDLSKNYEYNGNPVVHQANINNNRAIPPLLPLAWHPPPVGGMTMQHQFRGQTFPSSGPIGLGHPQVHQNIRTPNIHQQPNMNSWNNNQFVQYRHPPHHSSYQQQQNMYQAPTAIMQPNLSQGPGAYVRFNQTWHNGATSTVMNSSQDQRRNTPNLDSKNHEWGNVETNQREKKEFNASGNALQPQRSTYSQHIPNQKQVKMNFEKNNSDYKSPIISSEKSGGVRCFNQSSNKNVARNSPKETRSWSGNFNNDHKALKGQRCDSEYTRNRSENFGNEKTDSRQKRSYSMERRNNQKQAHDTKDSNKQRNDLGERRNHSRNRYKIKENHGNYHCSVASSVFPNEDFHKQDTLKQDATNKTSGGQSKQENANGRFQTDTDIGNNTRKKTTWSSENNWVNSSKKRETSNTSHPCSDGKILKKFVGQKVISEDQALAEGIDLNQSVHIIIMKNEHGEIYNPKTLRDIIDYKKKHPKALSYSSVRID